MQTLPSKTEARVTGARRKTEEQHQFISLPPRYLTGPSNKHPSSQLETNLNLFG